MQNRRPLKTAKVVLSWIACLLLVASSARFAAAEKTNMSPEAMRQISTDVIVGKVMSIDQTQEDHDAFHYTYYTAHIKIARVEKGNSLKQGGDCAVRYWHKDWKPGEGPKRVGNHYVIPAGSFSTFGHRGMPNVGDTRRIYLARNAYDGFTFSNKDGGYNVIGANGFEDPAAPVKPVKRKKPESKVIVRKASSGK